jgi:hypothetical protein
MGNKGQPAGPTPWPSSHTLSQFRLRLDGYSPKLVYWSIQCPRVGGDWEEWLTGYMDGRLALHHLQTDSIMWAERPLDLYLRILVVEFRIHHTLLVVLHL